MADLNYDSSSSTFVGGVSFQPVEGLELGLDAVLSEADASLSERVGEWKTRTVEWGKAGDTLYSSATRPERVRSLTFLMNRALFSEARY